MNLPSQSVKTVSNELMNSLISLELRVLRFIADIVAPKIYWRKKREINERESSEMHFFF